MMAAVKKKVKSRTKEKAKQQEALYSSEEEQSETLEEKWEKMEAARKNKRSRWGADSATLEISIDPPTNPNLSSDEEEDVEEEEEEEQEGPSQDTLQSQKELSQIELSQRDAIAKKRAAAVRPSRPTHGVFYEKTPNLQTLHDLERDFTPAPPNYNSWQEFFIANGQAVPPELNRQEVEVAQAPPANQPKKKKTKKPDLVPALAAFRFDHKDRLILGEEMNHRNKENPGPYTVAQYIDVGSKAKGNYVRYDLRDLGSDAIRKLASNFGCKGVSSASMFECRFKMAVRMTSGTTYGNFDIPNPVTTAAEKKENTYLRITTVVFLPQFINKFIKLNDIKTRKDMEEASGGSPYKQFWKEISETVNDAEQDEQIKASFNVLVDEEEAGSDETLRDLVTNGNYNLSDFNQVDWRVCAQSVRDVFKALENINGAMKQSGVHCTDLWQYCRKTFLKVRRNVEVPAIVAYYVSLLCKQHPGIEGNFAQSLEDHLKSDSTTIPIDTKSSSSGTGTMSKLKGDSTAFLEAFERTTSELQSTARADLEQRRKLIEYQMAKSEETEDAKNERNWKEYDALSHRVLSLKSQIRTCIDDEESIELCNYLSNLAVRVRSLEIQLDIEEHNSIVRDYLRHSNGCESD